jgi:thiol:disulfide interchange protein DsbD
LKILVSFKIALLLSTAVQGQNPVTWNYSVKRIDDKTFEVHLKATVQNGWHIYSQTQPREAIAIPTTIKFSNHPLIKLSGKTKENGKLEKIKEQALGIEAWQYSDKVEYVQTIILKTNVKTYVSGNIEYQTCTEGKCLPPRIVEFSLRLE